MIEYDETNFQKLTPAEKDQIGREKAIEILSQNYTIDHVDYTPIDSRYDLTFSVVEENRTYDYAGEVKYRYDYDSTAFPSGMLEVKKFNAIHEQSDPNRHKVYIMIWKDNVMNIWNIDKEPKVEKRGKWLPKDNITPDIKEYKEIWYLPKDQSTTLRYKN